MGPRGMMLLAGQCGMEYAFAVCIQAFARLQGFQVDQFVKFSADAKIEFSGEFLLKKRDGVTLLLWK